MLDPSAFRYDQQATLELTVLSERSQDGTTIQDVTYASPRGGEVPAYLIMAGVSDLAEYMQTTTHPLLVEERKHTPPEEYRAYLTAQAPLDAGHYIGQAAPSHLFFQFARDDEYVSVKDGERYFELASEPKQIVWYDHCNHAFNAQARLDRAIFLCEQLGLARPSQEMLTLLERVPSPIPLEDYMQALMEAKLRLEP